MGQGGSIIAGYAMNWCKKQGRYAKIMRCCKQAAEDGLKYIWIDTCYIDKTSSAELSEASEIDAPHFATNRGLCIQLLLRPELEHDTVYILLHSIAQRQLNTEALSEYT